MTALEVASTLEAVLGRPLNGSPEEIDRLSDRDPEAFEVLRTTCELGRRIVGDP